MSNIFFERITIIGLGLIGSSLAKVIREKKLCAELHGVDQNSASLNYMLTQKLIDFGHKSPDKNIADSELILICTPPSAVPKVIKNIAPMMKPETMVMDAASVKHTIAKVMHDELRGKCEFMPVHPIAGSEKSGPEAGDSSLFQKRRIILCPTELELMSDATRKAKVFWETIGGKVEFMPAELHDTVYAYMSHLPQLLAFAAKETLLQEYEQKKPPKTDIFRRFTRLGQSSGALWVDIFIENRELVCKAAEQYLCVVGQIHNELTSGLMKKEDAASEPESIFDLFPRLAASCLVTTLSIVEPDIGIRLLRLAGAGFVDFTAPVIDEPEKDIERISRHYRDVLPVIARYIQSIQRIKHLIQESDSEKLLTQLTAISQKGYPA